MTEYVVGPTRRAMMLQAIALVGGSVAASHLAACAPKSGAFFSAPEMELLRGVADVMIPATDTPGAVAAKAPEFVEGLMQTWASENSQRALKRAVAAIDARAKESMSAPFNKLSAAQKTELVAAHDAAAFAEGAAAEPAGDYRLLKRLVYHGYYLSEIGATQELQWKLAPGPESRGDAPLAEVGRTWAE